MVGTTISHYKVLEKIGQGGMGEVYRAEDTNLSRQVAIKVLPEQFTQDPQRLARFEREAKLLASLNHPNIAAIYGFEHSDSMHFLVLELVPGETLAEKVAKGPLPVAEALEVCRQIAEGVEAAHEKGVIHRDLKPANVKITPEGNVKILDFGLAKAFEAEPPITDISQSPTLTEEMTRAGVILGTAAYMSPEQARGKPVDKRADIFAFGCVLYELLTAKRAFEGETVTDTLAKILEGEPDWKRLPGATPWRIQELLRRCLTKDAHDRLPHIASVRIEVKLALSEPTAEISTGLGSAVQTEPWKRAASWSIAGVVAGALIVGLLVWITVRPSPPAAQPLTKFVIPAVKSLREDEGYRLAISPDGRHIVFSTSGQLYIRSLDDVLSTAIATSQDRTSAPFFSPDGEWLVFHGDGILKKDVAKLKGHYIVCGLGRLGKPVAKDLEREGYPLCIVEHDLDRETELQAAQQLYIMGDATDESVLMAAGIERAKVVLALLGSDADNLYLTLTVKELNPQVTVIARASDEKAERRLERSGADRVISLYKTAYKRILDAATKPTVGEFLELVTHREHLQLSMEVITVCDRSPLQDLTLAKSELRSHYGVVVVAI